MQQVEELPANLARVQGVRAEALALKYVWWQPVAQTLTTPAVLVVQIMDIGTLEDVQWLLGQVSRDALRCVLQEAPAGAFNQRSWNFWHLQFRMTPIPPLPMRPLPP